VVGKLFAEGKKANGQPRNFSEVKNPNFQSLEACFLKII